MKLMISNQIIIKKSKILILGFSFKEDCPDFRNTKIIDVHNELRDFGAIVEIYDPYVNKKEVKNLYSIDLINKNQIKKYDAIILAVGHSNFKKIDINDLKSSSKSVVFDVKGILDRNIVNSRL